MHTTLCNNMMSQDLSQQMGRAQMFKFQPRNIVFTKYIMQQTNQYISYLCSNANPAIVQSTNSHLISFTKFPQNIIFRYLSQQRKNRDQCKGSIRVSHKNSYSHHTHQLAVYTTRHICIKIHVHNLLVEKKFFKQTKQGNGVSQILHPSISCMN